MSITREVDALIAQKSRTANLAVATAIENGFVPSAQQVDALIAQQSRTANWAVETGFEYGFVPSAQQVDALIAQKSRTANLAVIAAYKNSAIEIVDCGRVGSGNPMVAIYANLPNGQGVLEERLAVDASCEMFAGEDPLGDIRKNIAGIPRQWRNGSPEQLVQWRASVNEALDLIVARAPAGVPDLSR